MRMALSERGELFALTSFASAVEALQRLPEVPDYFDIVFLNVKLPLLDIGEAVRALKSIPATAAAGVAIMIVDPSEMSAVPEHCDAILMPGTAEEFSRVLVSL